MVVLVFVGRRVVKVMVMAGLRVTVIAMVAVIDTVIDKGIDTFIVMVVRCRRRRHRRVECGV